MFTRIRPESKPASGKTAVVAPMRMDTDRVLFVVYDFPPEGSRGTKRSLKFIRHLPPHGWSAVVLTVRSSPNLSFHDDSLFAELPPGLPIYRARTLESLFHGSSKGDGVRGDGAGEAKPGPLSSALRRAVVRLYRRLGRFTKLPDSRILWLPFAVISGLRAIRQNRCRVIYTSGPSHTNHVVGAILSHVTRLPLVIDFRDAWVGNPARRMPKAWIAKGNAFLERFCVRSAKVVVCTTDGIRADFEKRYPDLPGKYVTIFNGFDQSDFLTDTSMGSRPRRPVLTIVHAGTLGRERSPREFLLALGQLLRENPELAGQVEVIFVGQNSPCTDGRTIEDYVQEYSCSSVVKLTGFVSRKASLEYIVRADVLLLIIGRVPKEGAFVYGISGKVYDYAAARRPVLTVSERGSTAQIVESLNLGPVVDPDDTETIKSTLVSLWEAHRSGSIPYNPNLELLKSFEFSRLTARLAACFDQTHKGEARESSESRG